MADFKLAYSTQEAADQVGKGIKVIAGAIKNGELIARYTDSHPIITHDDLKDWLKGLPTEKPGGDA